MTGYKDHFSRHAAEYTRYRPHYPRSLFAWLAAQTPRCERAWDCATGNGQAAQGLAEFFAEVIATDASEEQIAAAAPTAHVQYRVAPAERSGFDAHSVDLITVGQALHWFDVDAFYAEARRVLRDGGVLAVWCYGLLRIDDAVDAIVQRLHGGIVGPCWPSERRHVDNGYAELPFPFPVMAAPPFAMEAQWELKHLLGYLGTWSAVQRYRRQNGSDPLAQVADELAAAWGDATQLRPVQWPLHLRVGRSG